jgi:hypothetical protein
MLVVQGLFEQSIRPCSAYNLAVQGPLALKTVSTTSAGQPTLQSTSRFLAPHHLMADNSWDLFGMKNNSDSTDDDPFFAPIPEPQTDSGKWAAQMETSTPAWQGELGGGGPTANQQGTIPSKIQSSILLTVPIKSLQVLTLPGPARNGRGRANEYRLTFSNQTTWQQRDQSLIPLPKLCSLQSRARIQRASERRISHLLRLRHVRT